MLQKRQRFAHLLGSLLLLSALGRAAAQDAGSRAGEEPAEAQAAAGIASESVAEIMDRDRLAAPGTRKPIVKVEREIEFEKEPNREALEVASWPPTADGKVPEAAEGDTRLPQSVGVNFLGVLGGQGAGTEAPYFPPDSMGAVGPTQVVVVANGRIKTFDKNGTPGALDTTTSNFFASVHGNGGTSDPHVRYDRLSGRWFVVAITIVCPNRLLLAWSAGPTITNETSFSFAYWTNSALFDYPTLGVDRNALYVGGNVFACDGGLDGVRASVVGKADILDGGGITRYTWTGLEGPGIWTPQGVDNDDPAASQGYFVGVDATLNGSLGVRRVSNPGGSPPILGPQQNVTVPSTYPPLPQEQPPPGPLLATVGDRLFAAMMHRNKITGVSTLWTAHNIRVDANGVGGIRGDRNASRWYELGNLSTTPVLVQAGTLFDASDLWPFGYWIPSIAMSGQGHAALGASRASSSVLRGGYARIAVAGRLRTDALGATRSPTLAQSSTFVYGSSSDPEAVLRWGDYSQVVVDPNDDQTMWTFQEYAAGEDTLWGVRAIQLRAPAPASPSTATPGTIPPNRASLSVVITGTSSDGSEFFDPGDDLGGPGFARRLAAVVSGGVTVNSVRFDSPTQVTLDLSTVGAPLGPKNVTLTNPDGQSATGAGILTVGCPTIFVNPTDLPAGTAGVPYSQAFSQAGGVPPIAWALAGELPTGMALNSASGVLSGTPLETGSFPIEVSATDSGGCQGSVEPTLVISAAGVMVPAGLAVDAAGNGVFEAGETVTMAPSWRNETGAPASTSGVASAFTGPGDPDPAYQISDASAGYGVVAPGATASCSGTGDCYGLALGLPGARPVLHWDASVQETLSSAETRSWTLHVGESFADVPKASPFYRFVETLLHRGVTGGCASSSYCPANDVTREQLAVFALVGREGAGYSPAPCATPMFADVPAASPYCRFVEELARRGVVSGCGGGNYCPSASATREQMPVFVLRLLDPALDPPACGTPMFADVPASSPFCRWIEELARRGVVTGCGGGSYCPAAAVTREQMAVFIGVTFGLTLYGP